MTSATRSYVRAAVVCAAFLLLAAATVNAYAVEPKRILMLHSFGRDTSPYDSVTSTFRTEILRAWPGQAAFYDFALEAGRPVVRDENEGAIVEVIRSRFANMKLDLVVAVGPPAAQFYGKHREALFPSVPLLMLAMDQRIAPVKHLKRGDSIVGVKTSPTQVLNGILALLPDTTAVAVILGDSPGERFWLDEVRKEFAPFENRVTFLWLNTLTLPEMRERVATLRQGTVVLYGLFLADAAGIPYEEDYAITELHAASSVPMFGFFSGEMGKGIVGGALLSNTEQGVTGAKVASHLLSSESSQDVSATFYGPTTPQFDWRELQRWRIDESRLPPDSVVLFRPPSLWAEHKSAVLTGIVVLLLQAALIAALLAQLAHRRRAERESFALSWRLLTAHEDERRRLARELHDDVTQRLARLAIDAARIEGSTKSLPHDGSSPSVHGELVRLSEDVHALSYRLHPSILDDLGLAEALKAECEHISRHEPVRVEVEVHQVPDALPDDVALCIFRVAQEALRNVARHAKASVATVTLAQNDGGLLLAVSDNGIGFDIDAPRSRPSLGCASMGERVRLLGGRLGIKSEAGQGTTIFAWVPLGAIAS
jgi:signal transduction histidine kinase